MRAKQSDVVQTIRFLQRWESGLTCFGVGTSVVAGAVACAGWDLLAEFLVILPFLAFNVAVYVIVRLAQIADSLAENLRRSNPSLAHINTLLCGAGCGALGLGISTFGGPDFRVGIVFCGVGLVTIALCRLEVRRFVGRAIADAGCTVYAELPEPPAPGEYGLHSGL